ncbi:hypothetical protein [Mesorhizobium sp. M1399]|uniref:hypothetical protein n=1 Tax=Mesorhizobium sp. M1399 TaxID=2957096 RepID=UPI003337B054
MELNGGSLVLRVQLVEKVRRPFVNAGFRIAYLDLVDDRRTGEAEPYLAREHIRAHYFDERAYLFIRSDWPAHHLLQPLRPMAKSRCVAAH